MAYRSPYGSTVYRQRSRSRYRRRRRTRRTRARVRFASWRARKLKARRLPAAALIAVLLMTIFHSLLRTEESLWETCKTLYLSGDANGIAALKRYQNKYPEGKHLDDAAYYEAKLIHQNEASLNAKDAWQAVLNSPDLSRKIEASRRLGDCARLESDLETAYGYYQTALSYGVINEHSTAAMLRAGEAAHALDYHGEALEYLRGLWSQPSAVNQRIRASRLLQERTLSAVRDVSPRDLFYAVRQGESLTRIARRFGVGLNLLIRANPNVQPNLIRVGQQLTIPSHSGTMSALLSLSDRALFLVQNNRLVCPFPTVGLNPQAAALGIYRTERIDEHASQHSGAGRIELSGGLVILGGATEEGLRDPNLSPEIRLADEDMKRLMPFLRPGSQFTILSDMVLMDWIHIPPP